ncbi:MAG: response regulator transcription factor [Spirochaetales bacterium]|nr:response regulator transcription factor [Candidatus Physcosoma equi]
MIYCVEDDDAIRNMVVYTLTASGYEAEGMPCGKDLWQKLENKLPELILLDIMLPEEDGITILKKLKSNAITESIPVILATAKGTEYDKVIGLDMGADDYLAKPFGMMEMISRVKAVLRRCAPKPTKTIYTIGSLVLDDNTHTVKVHDEQIKLTLKEYEVLRLLLSQPKKVFSREELLKSIWGIENIGETRTVDVHIATLRTKIGECSSLIETVRGVGYRIEEGADQ